jgi:putative transcriptional regulator
MNRIRRIVLNAAVLLMVLVAAGARATDLSAPVVLVASATFDGTPLAQTVIIVAPVGDAGHIGFIVNRPTNVKLELLLPDREPAHNVVEPVYSGGPSVPNGLFALMQGSPRDVANAIPLLPGVIAVIDGDAIDRLIEKTPNAARYFVGMMLWAEGELEQQVSNGLWEVRPPDPQTVLPAKARGLWNSLRSPMASAAMAVRAVG